MIDDSCPVHLDGDQLARMRGEYGPEKDGCGDLDVDWLDVGWLALLRQWMSDAQRAGVIEPNAMVLATVAD
ncbi:pyridoxamine 5'-phosphate oxidase, partial [Mycobacterium simiae]